MATHEQYRPAPAQRTAFDAPYANQGYSHSNGYPSPVPQQAGQMMPYQPPQQQETSLMPPQQQAYIQNQAYQQNQSAFEPVHKSKPSRRPTPPETEEFPGPAPTQDNSESPPEQRERLRTTGGPLAGGATGAIIGGSMGQDRGHGPLGTLGGMIAGVFVGTAAEKRYLKHRQEKRELTEAAVRNDPENPQQKAQDQYDEEYTKLTQAVPGYGSSLLPADSLHGGDIQRNTRTS